MIEGCRAFEFGGWPAALALELQQFDLAVFAGVGGNPAEVIDTGLAKADHFNVFERPQPSPFFAFASSFVTWFM